MDKPNRRIQLEKHKINMCLCASIQTICPIHKSDKKRKLEMHREREKNAQITMDKPKRYPKPDYNKCNVGHTLTEIYNERDNAYYWDCSLCISKMRSK